MQASSLCVCRLVGCVRRVDEHIVRQKGRRDEWAVGGGHTKIPASYTPFVHLDLSSDALLRGTIGVEYHGLGGWNNGTIFYRSLRHILVLKFRNWVFARRAFALLKYNLWWYFGTRQCFAKLPAVFARTFLGRFERHESDVLQRIQ